MPPHLAGHPTPERRRWYNRYKPFVNKQKTKVGSCYQNLCLRCTACRRASLNSSLFVDVAFENCWYMCCRQRRRPAYARKSVSRCSYFIFVSHGPFARDCLAIRYFMRATTRQFFIAPSPLRHLFICLANGIGYRCCVAQLANVQSLSPT